MKKMIVSNKSNNFFRNIINFVLAFLLAMIIIKFVIENVTVVGNSMMPTVSNGDKVLIEKLSYRLEEPKIGDLAVFKYRADTRKRIVKRVIALEGDVVSIVNNKLYINRKPMKEEYILQNDMQDFVETTVPRDTVFVLGDNRNNSSDSRNADIGFVKKSLIIGKVFYRIYPFNTIGRVK